MKTIIFEAAIGGVVGLSLVVLIWNLSELIATRRQRRELLAERKARRAWHAHKIPALHTDGRHLYPDLNERLDNLGKLYTRLDKTVVDLAHRVDDLEEESK